MSGDQRSFEVYPIGVVESPLTDRRRAPRQGDEGAPEAWLSLDPALAPALDGIRVGDDLIVVTWLDRADRQILRTRPRDDAARDEQGVFSTRSPDRPNPIGLHEVTVVAMDGARLRVDRMDAIDRTPVIDIKPVLPAMRDR